MRRRPTARPLPLLGGLLALYLVVPFVAFAVRFARDHGSGFGTPGLYEALWTSVATATISTAVIAVVGIPLAYVLARSHGRIARLVGVLVALPLALPPLMSGIVLVELVGPYTFLGDASGRRLTDSVAGVVLAQTFVASPFLVISARAAFASMDPSLGEHAATLGHKELARFRRVSLPVCGQSIRAGLGLSWLRAFGEYGATVVLAYHPYTLPVFTYVQFSSTGLAATEAPTALALVAAVAAATTAFHLRLPRRRTRRPEPPPARRPEPGERLAVECHLDVRVGSFDLQVEHRAAGATLALLGPSGSGKSLTLRALAGLLGPGCGTVTFGGRVMDGVAAEDRRVGYVPQGYGLFPHLTVWRQITFGVGSDPAIGAYWLERLGLVGLEERLPSQLSGGQRQRVCLAQALARAPRLLLLDEPFSALDSLVRRELRSDLRRLLQERGTSLVLVTHDPEEAALLAEEVVVLAAGRVVDAGRTHDVFSHPTSPAGARLLGYRNVMPGRVLRAGVVVTAGVELEAETGGLAPDTLVMWAIRPEDIVVGEGGLRARVADNAYLGGTSEVRLDVAPGLELEAVTLGPLDRPSGASCPVLLPRDRIRVWAHDPAAHDSAAHDSAAREPAAHDPAAHDSAAREPAADDRRS